MTGPRKLLEVRLDDRLSASPGSPDYLSHRTAVEALRSVLDEHHRLRNDDTCHWCSVLANRAVSWPCTTVHRVAHKLGLEVPPPS